MTHQVQSTTHRGPSNSKVDNTTDLRPIDRHMQSQTAAMANFITLDQAAKLQYPAQFLQSIAMPVLGETPRQLLQYRQIWKHPKFSHIWNTSYSNELVQICQGVGKVSKGLKNQRVEGTNTFRIVRFEDIPRNRRKEIFHSMVVCEVRPQK